MTLTKSLFILISALALATGAAFAREELSLTEPGTGEELLGGYEVTSEGDVISGSEGFSEPMNGSDALALGPGEYLIYEETIVMTPSVDSETPQG